MKKTMSAITLACVVFLLFSTIASNAKGLANSNNPTTIALTLPARVGVPANTTLPDHLTMNAPISPETAKKRFELNFTPASPHETAMQPMWNNHWWIIDYWASIFGTGMPSKMNGTFVAVDNTIGGLVSDDRIYYLPLNVAYGTSSSDFVWFQFCIEFDADHNVYWRIYDCVPGYYPYQVIQLSYIPGHQYDFALTTSDPLTITFSIKDTTTGGAPWETHTWHNSIHGLTMIYNTQYFSPASAIEGRTTNSLLTNVPYLQTHLGYGEVTLWEGVSGSIPSGVDTFFWSGPINYYYWAMISTNYYTISSVYEYGPYGYGAVANASNIVGTVDGQYADIYGGNPGDGGYIFGNMNAPSGGWVYAYAYSAPDYLSDLYVYVSYDSQNWYQVGEKIRIDSSSPSWVYVGRSPNTFRYIAVCGYDWPYSVNLHVDAVKISY